MTAKDCLKALLARTFSDYRVNWIYASVADCEAAPLNNGLSLGPLAATQMQAILESSSHKFRNTLSFHKGGLAGFVLSDDKGPVCVAHFASPDQYRHNATWPIRANEVALVDIATDDRAKGKGYAPVTIRAATQAYREAGIERLIAFIWWSNKPSIRSFEKAGWVRIGLAIEVRTGKRWRSLRIPLPHRSAAAQVRAKHR